MNTCSIVPIVETQGRDDSGGLSQCRQMLRFSTVEVVLTNHSTRLPLALSWWIAICQPKCIIIAWYCIHFYWVLEVYPLLLGPGGGHWILCRTHWPGGSVILSIQWRDGHEGQSILGLSNQGSLDGGHQLSENVHLIQLEYCYSSPYITKQA